MRIILFFLGVMCFAGCQSQSPQTEFVNGMAMTPVDFQELIHNDDYVLIDIRNEWEMEQGGVIDGMDDHKNVYDPLHVTDLESLDKNKNYLFYCAHGVRSNLLKEHLMSLGFSGVYDLEGGVAGWEDAGLNFVDRKE